MRFFAAFFFAFCTLLLFAGCATSPTGSYQSLRTYDRSLFGTQARRAFQYQGIARNPVVIIHGFLGARLTDAAGDVVWGDFSAKLPDEDILRHLAFQMRPDLPLAQRNSGVRADSILDEAVINVGGFTFKLRGYQAAVDLFTAFGYVTATNPMPAGKLFPSLYSFAYDWRNDLPENAKKLKLFLEMRRRELQKAYEEIYGIKNYDVQFDLVGHSMGGLLGRYFLMYGDQELPADGVSLPKLDWAGARIVDKLIVVGTPNDGYLDTFVELVGGLKLQRGAPVYPPGIIATFPSYYQMLPGIGGGRVIYKNDPEQNALDLFDYSLWVRHGWGLADPANDSSLKMLLPHISSAAERRKIALDHLKKCLGRARHFRRAMAIPALPPDDVAIYLFVGDAVETSELAEVDPQNGKVEITGFGVGDGKVLASSARYDLRGHDKQLPFSHSPVYWTSVTHVPAAHMGLFASSEFADNVGYILLMLPTRGQRQRFDLNFEEKY